MTLFGTSLHEKLSPIAAHLNNLTIPTQTPVSSGENGTITSPVLMLGRVISQIKSAGIFW